MEDAEARPAAFRPDPAGTVFTRVPTVFSRGEYLAWRSRGRSWEHVAGFIVRPGVRSRVGRFSFPFDESPHQDGMVARGARFWVPRVRVLIATVDV